MCTSDDRYVSPYLLRPIRSYAEVMGESRRGFATAIRANASDRIACTTRAEGERPSTDDDKA